MELDRRAEALAITFGGPPCDVDAVAHTVGILWVAVEDIEPSAVLSAGPVEDSWMVVIRKDDSFVKRRFSLAHEAAHVVLGIVGDERRYRGKVAARGGRLIRNPEEATCDYFAGALLMPRSWMLRAAEEHPPQQLARRFDVSSDAVRIRLEQLGLYAVAKMV